MEKLKKILSILGIIVLLAGAGALYYYVYQGIHFFSTEDAQVTCDMVNITPELTGQVKNWDIKEGEQVKSGQVLGKQDVSSMITSLPTDSQSMANPADLFINKSEIKSPIDGKVVKSNVIKGQVISPGMEIATIADTSHFYIKAHIEETDILKIAKGQKVDIKIDAYAKKSFQGYVENIGQATTSAFSTMPSLNTSGTYSKVTQLIPIYISIMDADQLNLMPGLNAVIKIHIK